MLTALLGNPYPVRSWVILPAVCVCVYLGYVTFLCVFECVPCSQLGTRQISPQTASPAVSFPKLALLKHKLILWPFDPSVGKPPWGWTVVYILVMVKDVVSSKLCCFSLVSLENQGTAWAGGLVSKMRKKFKKHRNVSKLGKPWTQRLRSPLSSSANLRLASISIWR